MSNSVSRSYPKDNQDTSLREETLCLCPPETSPLDEVGGGIPARHMLLTETVSGGLSFTGDFLLSDLDELLKDFFPVNGSAVPFNLEQ